MRQERAHTLFSGLNLAGAPGCLQHGPPGASHKGSSVCLQPVLNAHHPGTGSPSRAPSPLSLHSAAFAALSPRWASHPLLHPHFFSCLILLTFQGSDVRRKQCVTPRCHQAVLAAWPGCSPLHQALPSWPAPQTRSRNRGSVSSQHLGQECQLPCWLSTAALSSFTDYLGTTITSSWVSWRVNEVMHTHQCLAEYSRVGFKPSSGCLFLTQKGALF